MAKTPEELGAELGIKDPAVLQSWLKTYAPQASSPIMPGAGIDVSRLAPSTAKPLPVLAVAKPAPVGPDPMATALAAANRTPGSAPPPQAPPPKSLFDAQYTPSSSAPVDNRQPKNGDWEGHNKYIDQKNAQQNAANLAGATFYKPPPGVGAFGPSGPVMVSPGGRRPASWTEQTTEGIELPKTEAAYARADEAKGTALAAARDVGTMEAHRELGYLEEHEKLQGQREKLLADRAEKQRAALELELGKARDLQARVQTDKIDPDAWFTKNGGRGAFFGAIAKMLGAVGQGLKGGPNEGAEAVRLAAQQEIDAQKANAQLNRQKLEDSRFLLGQMAKTFGDERMGEEAAHLAYLEKAKTHMGRIAAETKDATVRARYLEALAALGDQQAARMGQLEQLAANKVVRSQHDVNAMPTFMGGGGPTVKPDELFVPTGPNGEGFRARSEKEAQAARGLAAAKQDLVPMLERLEKLREDSNVAERAAHKYGGYESERMAEIKSLQAQVALGLRELSAQSPGAMDKGMQDLAGQIQGDWTSVQGNPQAAARAFKDSIFRKLDSYQRGQAGQDEQQGLTRDMRGNVVTKAYGQPSFKSPKAETPKSFERAK
jgi:hypothetical protein